MNQYHDVTIKCPNTEHTQNVTLVCFDESCKGERLYCHQCIKNGNHISHPQNQEELPFLFEHIQRVEKECADLIHSMNQQFDLVNHDFQLLIDGIRSKYQITKQQLLNLNSKQINSYLSQSIYFRQFEFTTIQLVQQLTNEIKSQIQKLLSDLQLNELNYYQFSKLNLNKSEELYQRGYKLYLNDKKFDEAIKIFDQALALNSRHQLSLWCKADSLKMLGYYNEAIIWTDKALQLDPRHCNSLYSKAESLKMLGLFNEAILWADKALEVDPKHCHSLYTKGDSLRLLKKYNEAMKVIDYSLQINPNHLDSLRSKGACLQDQKHYQEALIFYSKALAINSNHEWTKNRKNECLKALEIK
ncbi:unnamed protein product [Paramecium primaurelia]|uniref:Tetratricopeptide repeat protein n=1 Tax=Paramecium primaurelia TaxID=5886 RepID=A0A8S1MIH8_PARPR|nr:unnamed protein product [Paramecium primaurelia]